jgi:hypothetical protein
MIRAIRGAGSLEMFDSGTHLSALDQWIRAPKIVQKHVSSIATTHVAGSPAPGQRPASRG